MEWGSGPFWAYVLQNPQGGFYIGSTDDLARRIAEHNCCNGVGTKYSHKNGPWALVWAESHPTRAAAMRREKSIKAMKSARWIRQNLLNA